MAEIDIDIDIEAFEIRLKLLLTEPKEPTAEQIADLRLKLMKAKDSSHD